MPARIVLIFPFMRNKSLWLALAMLCSSAHADDSLYTRMGGAQNVSAVVNELIDKVSADPKLKRSFEDVDTTKVKEHLLQQICQLSGGGCQYEGDSMRDTHGGLGITQAEFYGMVEV